MVELVDIGFQVSEYEYYVLAPEHDIETTDVEDEQQKVYEVVRKIQ